VKLLRVFAKSEINSFIARRIFNDEEDLYSFLSTLEQVIRSLIGSLYLSFYRAAWNADAV